MVEQLKRTATLAGVSLASLLAFGAAWGQNADHLAATKASVIRDAAQLSAAGRSSARDSLGAIMAQRGASQATIDSIVETAAYSDRFGQRFVRFEQRIEGLRVHGAYGRVALDSQGNLVQVIERFAPAATRAGSPGISDTEALRIAIAANFGTAADAPGLAARDGAVSHFADSDFFYRGPTVERVLVARGANLEEGFLVETWSDGDNLLYHTLIDGRGRVVANELRTAEDSYNIFADHPGVSPQTVVTGPGAGNAESPSGWLAGAQRSISVRGNNVHAYLDRDNNNGPDAGGVSISDGNFVATADLTSDPTTAGNQNVAVQNLFYLNNVIHDTLYRHGFVESVGNFQNDNFGRGGSGNDAVNAEAQDGGGTNNANFSTPTDGSPGRMQMYLWTQTTPRRDGDLDSDIVWHEYGHGLTWRMIGSMSGPISGALGEGMSDVLAIVQNDQPTVGEYSYNNPNGIRRAAYDNYPYTLGDFTGSSVHSDGEIYAATIWHLKGAYANNDLLMDDLIGGMNFTPAGPDYPDMRDGIIAQVNARSGDACVVWESFAAFGIGEGARMSVKGGGPFGGGKVSVTESFAVPSACGGEPPPPPGDATLTGFSGTSASQGRNRWRATATATVDVADATVEISFSDGSSGSCTTSGANGSCSVSSSLRNNIASVTATVMSINGGAVTLGAGVNNPITINRP